MKKVKTQEKTGVAKRANFIKKDYHAYINAPTVLIGMALLMFMVLLFCDAMTVASRGIRCRNIANTISKQISVAGEVNEDTVKLAESLCVGFDEMSANDRENGKLRFVRIVVTNDEYENSTLMEGTCLVMGNDGSDSEFKLTSNTNVTVNGKTIDKKKIQLGKTATVEVYFLNEITNTGVSDGKLINQVGNYKNNSTFDVKAKAVSQIYWKELDVS